jgi:ribosomal protein S19
MFCRYKRRSIWKGFFLDLKTYEKIVGFVEKKIESQREVQTVSRTFILYPFLQNQTFNVYTGRFFNKYTVRSSNVFFSKIGQYVYTLKMGASMHSQKNIRKGGKVPVVLKKVVKK